MVGGFWKEGEEDRSYLAIPEDGTTPKLGKDELAQCSLHFVMKRPDDDRFVFDVCTLPQRYTMSSSKETPLFFLFPAEAVGFSATVIGCNQFPCFFSFLC